MGKQGLNHDRILCARAKFEEDKPKDACSGDNGGPIFSSAGLNDQSDSKYLRGITSIGSVKCGSVSYNIRVYILIHTNIDINIWFCSLHLLLKKEIRILLPMDTSLECTQKSKSISPGFWRTSNLKNGWYFFFNTNNKIQLIWLKTIVKPTVNQEPVLVLSVKLIDNKNYADLQYF